MTWEKHFTHINPNKKLGHMQGKTEPLTGTLTAGGKFSSYLPEVYAGQPQRLERYKQYFNMDQDAQINASLDTIADFCTQTEEQADTPFRLTFMGEVTDTETMILNESLIRWTRLNEFKRRIWRIFRNTIMYGDAFFIRDPETFKWIYVDHSKVQSIVVDEAQGKKPQQYNVADLDINLQSSVATKPTNNNNNSSTWDPTTNNNNVTQFQPKTPGQRGSGANQNVASIDAKHVVHLSLSEGLDNNWPFGNSILEAAFKAFKQKELLEDSIIIYRVQRAPERRVFYIDVGGMPAHKAMTYIERVKNEIHQRRIPNRTGGGTSILDAAYNPLSIIEDYFFAQTAEGRGSKVETLPGGENLGDITDLEYFNRLLRMALRVPNSYLPGASDDAGATYNDGRTGTAYIQEYHFARYCMRLQNLLSHVFDKEFKRFLENEEINIDTSLFELEFHEPQSFSKYRQIEIDSAQINIFQPLAEIKYMSKRFLMKRFLNLTEDEILENERMWKEENAKVIKNATGSTPADEESVDMSSVGIRPPGDDLGGDMDFSMDDEGGEGGDMGGDDMGGSLDGAAPGNTPPGGKP